MVLKASVFAAFSILLASIASSASASAPVLPALERAEFHGEAATQAARAVADWVVASHDNHDLPFVIVDKLSARLYLFDTRGSVQATAPVLLGLARGDVSPPGIGDRPLAQITPSERITPAGRFVASKGVNLAGRDIMWVDYDAAIALHRATDLKAGLTVRDRLARLASGSLRDNRISHGCINVSDAFYDSFIRPTFATTSGIFYVLPDTRPLGDVFPLSDPTHLTKTSGSSPKFG